MTAHSILVISRLASGRTQIADARIDRYMAT